MNRKIPKTLALCALTLCLTLVLAACGGATPTPTPRATATPAPGQTPVATPTPTAAPAFDAAAYFRGKTLRLMTSSNPGGGTDVQMRYLASAIAPFIPGRPRIIASNIPPHVVGKNYIAQARPDGLTIGLFSTSMLREENFPNATYNSAELTYIADVGLTANVFTIRGTMPYQTIQDAMGASGPVIRTMTDAPDPGNLEALIMAQMMLADFLDIPFEVVRTAERGTGPAMLAIERGDITGYNWGGGAWALVSTLRPGWLTEGFIRPLYHFGPGRGFYPNAEVQEITVPHAYDLMTEEQVRIYVGVTEASRNMDRPLVLPPAVPAHIHQALIDAFYTAFHDASFCEGWTRVTGAPCAWQDGEVVKQLAIDGQAAMNEFEADYGVYAARYFSRYIR